MKKAADAVEEATGDVTTAAGNIAAVTDTLEIATVNVTAAATLARSDATTDVNNAAGVLNNDRWTYSHKFPF